MKTSFKLTSCFAALLLVGNVYAADIEVAQVWSRATAPQQDSAMVDMRITSKQAASLVGVTTPAAASVELHTMSHDHGMMKMREVKSIDLPAGKAVSLGESGYHLMLIGLKAPLKAGSNIPLTLTIKTGKDTVKVETQADVKPLTDSGEEAHSHHHHH
jgi:copper(I)-binding protein